ncbi:GNAT family N-acetyltransferase [Bacillus aerius]|uniref:GNAT family N-acetyltransferase n=1 Tax=Bacillus aerius TaxID=293388 RepID=UPI00247BF4CA|nr:GNAT family N-acetyltransferase [Bacillus aerius]MDH6595645.1 ribosomal protein S18 acetylase RimI-like enzyme [Bacillus aerius]
MLTIRRIYQKNYPKGKQVYYQYTSEKYYDIHMETSHNGWNISLTEEEFEAPVKKNLKEEIFDPYKEGSEVYVSEMNGEETGIIVIQHMKWNNTLLIHDLYVDKQFKRKGIGSTFIKMAKKRARELRVRMIVLETQSSNFPAIQFYLKNGFQLIGLNVNSYSNEDMKKKEIRIEMGCLIENHN